MDMTVSQAQGFSARQVTQSIVLVRQEALVGVIQVLQPTVIVQTVGILSSMLIINCLLYKWVQIPTSIQLLVQVLIRRWISLTLHLSPLLVHRQQLITVAVEGFPAVIVVGKSRVHL